MYLIYVLITIAIALLIRNNDSVILLQECYIWKESFWFTKSNVQTTFLKYLYMHSNSKQRSIYTKQMNKQ